MLVTREVEDEVEVEDQLTALDESLEVALRFGTQNRLQCFKSLLDQHKDHESFRAHQWPMTLEMGFTCACSGHEQEWRIGIRSIREQIPAAREFARRFQNDFQGLLHKGNKARKRKARRAKMRARALLHRHLTKEQRWTLRGARFFDVVGSDGRTYRITEGSCNNVLLLGFDGEPNYSFCVIADYKTVGGMLPIYDLMLAQKVMLETDAEAFIKTAKVYKMTDANENGIRHLREVEIPEEALEDPGPWVEAQLREAAEGQEIVEVTA